MAGTINLKFQISNFKLNLGAYLLPFAFCLFTIHPSHAQYFTSKNYPKKYFRNPLAIPLELSGNFGELRRDHFHMGLDIRTQQKENLPVFAAASGYISRIKIERFGYGRAIYITHPNGFTTLYAHLNNFFPTLNEYVKAKQYKDEKWEQDFALPPNKFIVGKGQQIAWSGNTGGSQGPHLHFEIRDKKGNNQNPLLFGFAIKDVLPPLVYKLFYYNRTGSIYSTKALPIPIEGKKNNYTAIDTVVSINSPKISFGITAEDITNSSPFKFGIYQAELWIDDTMKSAFQLNDFPYESSRYINASIDYSARYTKGNYIQHLSKLPGNGTSIFANIAGDGVITINDTNVHKAEIYIKDVVGNTAVVNYKFRYVDSLNVPIKPPPAAMVMLPQQENELIKDDIKLNFSSRAFYDTVLLGYAKEESKNTNAISATHQLCCYDIPVHNYYSIAIKKTISIADSLKDKTLMQLTSNGSSEAVKGSWEGDWYEASFNRLGNVVLIIDTTPPTIKPIGWADGETFANTKEIRLRIVDDETAIQNCRAELDGSWLLFARKDNEYIYTFDEHCTLGWHTLKLIAEDEAGNTTIQSFTFEKKQPKPTKSGKKVLGKKAKPKNNGTKRRR
jgi:Peptidase family M23